MRNVVLYWPIMSRNILVWLLRYFWNWWIFTWKISIQFLPLLPSREEDPLVVVCSGISFLFSMSTSERTPWDLQETMAACFAVLLFHSSTRILTFQWKGGVRTRWPFSPSFPPLCTYRFLVIDSLKSIFKKCHAYHVFSYFYPIPSIFIENITFNKSTVVT